MTQRRDPLGRQTCTVRPHCRRRARRPAPACSRAPWGSLSPSHGEGTELAEAGEHRGSRRVARTVPSGSRARGGGVWHRDVVGCEQSVVCVAPPPWAPVAVSGFPRRRVCRFRGSSERRVPARLSASLPGRRHQDRPRVRVVTLAGRRALRVLSPPSPPSAPPVPADCAPRARWRAHAGTPHAAAPPAGPAAVALASFFPWG